MRRDWINIIQHISASHIHAFHERLSHAFVIVLVDVDITRLEIEPGQVITSDGVELPVDLLLKKPIFRLQRLQKPILLPQKILIFSRCEIVLHRWDIGLEIAAVGEPVEAADRLFGLDQELFCVLGAGCENFFSDED